MSDNRKDWKIGICGHGFLGSAITQGFALHADIKIYDKYKKGFNTIEEMVDHAEFIFFGLPTPMFDDNGEQDLSILDGAVKNVHDLVPENSNKIAVIKSTVLPGTNRKFQEKYPKLKFVSNPEHLTARSNLLDFINASKNVIGAEDQHAGDRVEALYRHRFGNSMPIFRTSFEMAELEKYAVNTFYALKVSFANYLFSMCDKLGLDYDELKDIVLAQGTIGRTHFDVPGWDGFAGYSGACLCKDINALIVLSDKVGINPELLRASWSQNLQDRPNKDWEQLPGVISKRKK